MGILALIDVALKVGKPLAQIPAVGKLINKTLDNGKKEVSKTKAGALLLAGSGPDWADLLTRAAAKDPAAIGQIILILGGLALSLAGYETAARKK